MVATLCLSSITLISIQIFIFFFFFQAEDGIRDLIVTGVQTCALPISAIPQNGVSGNSGNPADEGTTAGHAAITLPDLARGIREFLACLDSYRPVLEYTALHAGEWAELRGYLVKNVWDTYYLGQVQRYCP